MNRTISLMSALLSLLLFCACQNTTTHIGNMTIYHHSDITTEPVRVVYPDVGADALFALCVEIYNEQAIPIRFAENGMIRSKTMRDEDISWRLYVKVSQSDEGGLVESYMKIHSHTDVEFNPVGSLIDSLLESGPEYDLEELEKEHRRGKITYLEYHMRRQELEDRIEAEEEERRRKWEDDNQERIERVTRRGLNFHPLLESYLRRNADLD